MAEIPQEALQAAAQALHDNAFSDEPRHGWPAMALVALEAAFPLLAAQVRRETAQKIAAAIEGRRCRMDRQFCDKCVCRRENAALARQRGEADDPR